MAQAPGSRATRVGACMDRLGPGLTREDGRPLHPREVTRAFSRHVLGAGVPIIRLQDLRHTHATLALAAGVHPKVVQERLGHANIAIALDTYSHAVPALEEEAARTVAALVFGQ
jgi:integrase